MSVMERIGPCGEVAIKAEGAVLAGRLILPTGPMRAAVVLHGATGVPSGYYRAFADWLAAERNCAVLTYDYRDFGASARKPVAQSKARMDDWGRRDQAAALEALGELVPGAPRWVIGHSLGGLWLGFHAAMAGVERVITVGSGLINIRDHPFPFSLQARFFWHGPVPFLARRLGYLPGARIGFGADLPLRVYEDWRRWCLSPGFHMSDVGRSLPMPDVRLVTAEMRVVAVSDDPWVPPAAIWRAMSLYPEATKRQLVLRPETFGLKWIGHLGAFHRRNAVLWPAILDPV
jgi:predicted alpha/beta hydrolase